MSCGRAVSVVFIGLMSLWPLQTRGDAQQLPVQIPQPGVPQIITMEGKFVRASYNREGYVILGYQASNRSIGEEWMLRSRHDHPRRHSGPTDEPQRHIARDA